MVLPSPGPATSELRATLFVLITAAAAGCYSPGIQPCELACSANRECPDGLTCNGQNACAMTSSAMCNELPIDAPPGDTMSNMVTIEVRDRTGGPLAAALVVFADPAGAQIAEMQTGADGKAIADVPAGGSATVIRMVPRPPPGASTDLHASTYLDLWPGAHIISAAEIDQRTRTVNFQVSPPSTATTTYHVYTSCTGFVMATTPQIAVEVPLRCPMFDAFVIASNPTNPMVNFAAVLPAQTGPAIGVPSASFRAWSPLSGALTGLPGNAGGRTLNLTPWATPGLPAPNRPLALVSPPASGGFGSITFPTEAGVQSQLAVTYPSPMPGVPGFVQVVTDRFPAGTTSLVRDYNATFFQWLGKPAFDVGSRRMTWPFYMPTTTTPAAPSFFVAFVTYNHDPNMGVIWRLFGDATRITTSGAMQSIAFPDVPGMRTFEPIASDVVTSQTVTLFGVEPAAVRDVRQVLETEGTDLNYFKIPTLRHMTVSIGQ